MEGRGLEQDGTESVKWSNLWDIYRLGNRSSGLSIFALNTSKPDYGPVAG